jgi:GH15 family glucan-1,4-alpha-glucosidase
MTAVGGPDTVCLGTDVPLDAVHPVTTARFEVDAGQRASFVLTWHPSERPPPRPVDPEGALRSTVHWWRRWMAACRFDGPADDVVRRSFITLKALTYAPTGGVVAAPTTSLPEALGGVRNWDYRYCWVRDATFTLQALLEGGFTGEAVAWRDWMLRAVAGEPAGMQIMYGVAGEQLLPEIELPWLSGYEGSTPVRIGNAASDQFQLDVYGEVMDMLHQAHQAGIHPDQRSWHFQTALMEFLEGNWSKPDDGIWESRGGRRQFTHSKVMAWVAADRAVRAIDRFGLGGDADRWRRLREEIHADVCQRGWNDERGAFSRSYGSQDLDAALLMLPVVGFLPVDDPRVVGTVEAIQKDLCHNGFVLRYDSTAADDGLPPGEATFLPCTLWLADALALIGRQDEGRAIFDRVVGLANDVGLLAEEYDPDAHRMLGNFPQALSHIALINTARNLSRPGGPADARRTP